MARDRVVGADAAGREAFHPNVPADVKKSDDARPALEGVEPVGHPGIGERVGFSAPPDPDAVDSVKSDGDPDDGEFDGEAPGNVFEARGGFVEIARTYESVAVGPEMLDEKCADRNDAG